MNHLETSQAHIRILADGLAFPEGPAFDSEGRLWFVELKGGNLVRLEGGILRRFPTGGAPNGIAIAGDGSIWFCDSAQMAIRRFDPAPETFTTVCSGIDGVALNKPNDLAFDPCGNLIFTCPGDSRQMPTGYVCCLKPDGEVIKIRDGMYFPNGLAFGPEGKHLVVAETYRQRLWRGAWDATANRWIDPAPWCTDTGGAPGPDGMAYANSGLLYVAVYGSGAITVVDATGHVVRKKQVPGANPTNCVFDPRGVYGLVVTEAEKGLLLSIPGQETGAPLFSGVQKKNGNTVVLQNP